MPDGIEFRPVGIANHGLERNARLSGKLRTDELDKRSEAQRDKDRLIYSAAWRRLGGVTQVITPFDDAALLHNRLTHSEKVAQVSRSIAERLVGIEQNRDLLARLGGFDVDVCEAAAMAHDLGHPPFGHVGEVVLDRLARKELGLADGFEGNAQSIRIATVGKIRSQRYEGLDLTMATLSAIAKYPWMRAPTRSEVDHDTDIDRDSDYRRHWLKFNFYRSEENVLKQCRAFTRDKIGAETQTLEASVMDVADDISYAVHDLEDFYLGGILDVAAIREDLEIFRRPVGRAPTAPRQTPFDKLAAKLAVDYHGWFDEQIMFDAARYVDSELGDHFRRRTVQPALVEADTRQAGSTMIGRFIGRIILRADPLWGFGPHVGLDREAWHEVQILKEITKSYVIQRPDIALLQRGQQFVLEELVRMLNRWAESKTDRNRLPARLLDEVSIAESLEGGNLSAGYDRDGHAPRGPAKRAILDYVCSLGDQQCLSLYYKLSGIQVHRVGMSGGF